MSQLQLGVRLIECVAVPVSGHGRWLRTIMPADSAVLRRTLVNVVAEMHDQFDVLVRQMPKRREVTVFVVLAGGKDKREALRTVCSGGRSAGPADRAQLRTGAKLIPVPARRLEAARLHVDRVP